MSGAGVCNCGFDFDYGTHGCWAEKLRERCQKLNQILNGEGNWTEHIEAFAREIRNEALEEAANCADNMHAGTGPVYENDVGVAIRAIALAGSKLGGKVMSDNYDGPAMAQQIIRLQARVKELEAQILAIVNTDTKCYDENAKLRKAVDAARKYAAGQSRERFNILKESLNEMDVINQCKHRVAHMECDKCITNPRSED